MKTAAYALMIVTAFATPGCATYWDALSYKPSQTGPKATINVSNQNERGIITVSVFANEHCTGGQKPLSAPLKQTASTSKQIDAERPFTFSISGNAGSDGLYHYGCGMHLSFIPREGKTYDLVYYGNALTCNVALTELAKNGQHVPVAFQKKTYKVGLTKSGCE